MGLTLPILGHSPEILTQTFTFVSWLGVYVCFLIDSSYIIMNQQLNRVKYLIWRQNLHKFPNFISFGSPQITNRQLQQIALKCSVRLAMPSMPSKASIGCALAIGRVGRHTRAARRLSESSSNVSVSL